MHVLDFVIDDIVHIIQQTVGFYMKFRIRNRHFYGSILQEHLLC